MEGVEDNGPPAKRMKVSSGGGLSNALPLTHKTNFPLCDPMAQISASKRDDEVIGSKGVIKKVELVQVITNALYSLGYSKTGARLEEESGIPLHTPLVELLMSQILDSKWDDSIRTLHGLGLEDERTVRLASFAVLEQKFLELLCGGKIIEALTTLRMELTPLHINDDRVRELSYLSMFPSQMLGETSDQESRIEPRKKLLEELRTLLPPSIMIPEKRLVHLVEQALALQKDACRFHNSSADGMSLFTDHRCGRERLPSQLTQILREHRDEVWFLQFSHNGKYLASSSGDCLVIVWEVAFDGQVSLRHKLSGHQKPVSQISWSPDDNQLLSCGVEETVRRWDVLTGKCLHVYEKGCLGLISCVWAPDGTSICSGITDKSIIMWDLGGKELECWKGQKTVRIADLAVTHGKELITVCRENMIRLFGLESKSERFIKVDHIITSFVLSADGKFLLVSLLNQELHLWNIDGCVRFVAKYEGHKRSRFVVRSCFGGSDQAFIASGSEDSQIYIWHRVSGDPILTLSGHSGAVNCVSWNPANPHMLASGSDDRTIRIWGLNPVNMNNGRGHSNGIHHCNGETYTKQTHDGEQKTSQAHRIQVSSNVVTQLDLTQSYILVLGKMTKVLLMVCFCNITKSRSAGV